MVVDRENETKAEEFEKEQEVTNELVEKVRGMLREYFPVKVPENEMAFLVCVVTRHDGDDLVLDFLGAGTTNDKFIMLRQMLQEILRKHPVMGMMSLLNSVTGISGTGKVE